MSTQQAIAPNGNATHPSQVGAPANQSNDYINHYLAGNPIIYIWNISSYPDADTGELIWYYKANMKTGPKNGKIYIPLEGSLSKYALAALEPVIEFINSKDPDTKRSVGVKVKSPRFEGVSSFTPKDSDESVGVARFRLNTILDMRLFKKKKANNPAEPSMPMAEVQGDDEYIYEFEEEDILF